MNSTKLLVALLVTLLAAHTLALKADSVAVNPSRFVPSRSTVFETFGFAPGGSVTLHGSVQPSHASIFVYLCDESEYQSRMRSDNWNAWLCDERRLDQLDDALTSIKAPLDGSFYHYNITVYTMMYMMVISCDHAVRWEAKLSYQLYSIDADEVSYEERPLPRMFSAVATLWSIVFIACSVHLWFYRAKRTPLHGFLFALLTLALFGFIYWRHYADSGLQMSFFLRLRSVGYGISEALFFATLFLVAQGWRITRTGVPARETRNYFITLIFLVAAMAFFTFYDNQYYWLSLIVMYCLAFPRLVSLFTRNTSILQAQADIIRQRLDGSGFDFESVVSSLDVKRRTMHILRMLLFSYYISLIAVYIVFKLFLSWEYAWVSVSLNEALAVLCIAAVLVLLSPQRKDLFIVSAEDQRPLIALQNLIQSGNLEQAMASMPEPWDMKRTILVQYPQASIKSAKSSSASSAPSLSATSPIWNVAIAYEQSLDDEEMRDKRSKE